MDNPYKILGISRTTDKNLAGNNYIKLTKKFHPDTFKSSLHIARAKMKQPNNTYDLIID